MAVVVRLGAGHEGIQAFEPVDETFLYQRVQRTVDLKRRAKAALAKLVEQRIGAERTTGGLEWLERAKLVLRQSLPCRHDSASIFTRPLSSAVS